MELVEVMPIRYLKKQVLDEDIKVKDWNDDQLIKNP